MSFLMSEAQAHETIFPHIHPHAQYTWAQDLGSTLFFLGGIFFTARLIQRKLKRPPLQFPPDAE